jgi:hypothetical protein
MYQLTPAGYQTTRGNAESAAEALHQIAANAYSLIQKSREVIEATDRRLGVASNHPIAHDRLRYGSAPLSIDLP